MSMYSYYMFMYLLRARWHSSVTVTEVFPCFLLSCKANAGVKSAKMGHGPHSSRIFVFFYVLFVLCRSVYFLCVNVYCATATGWLPNCSEQIRSYIISKVQVHKKKTQPLCSVLAINLFELFFSPLMSWNLHFQSVLFKICWTVQSTQLGCDKNNRCRFPAGTAILLFATALTHWGRGF